MTKKQWFARLGRFIGGLPAEERKKIFDYYEELYADKRESGMTEWEILAEFGNPQEVAGKILSEMSTLHSEDLDDGDAEDWEDEKPSRKVKKRKRAQDFPPQDETRVKRKFSLSRFFVFLCVLLPLGILLFALLVAAWAIFLALTVAGVAVALGGGGASVYTLVTAFDATVWVAGAGAGLVCVGVGVLLCSIAGRLVGFFVKMTGKLCKSFANFVFRRVRA